MSAVQRGLFSSDTLEDGEVIEAAEQLAKSIHRMSVDRKVASLNAVRRILHTVSPFASEPVDCVQWIDADLIAANDYNPNAVAPPEMKLLEHSIGEDGYTQPIVGWKRETDSYEVVDGFHRHRVGRESKVIRQRILGFLPISIINDSRHDRGDRIAATIRHNRARGKHRVQAMSDIVVELKRRNWSEERICRELGMEPDEVLRLCQITGLAELFVDQAFSKSWDVEGEVTEADFREITDDVSTYGDEADAFRTVNTGGDRIFHTYEKWECYAAGFYAHTKEGATKAECEEAYRAFLSDSDRFDAALAHVTTHWKHSCEHYLTNVAMNRIAWLGQASACYAIGVPAVYRGGFFLLSQEEQDAANALAHQYLNKWLVDNGREPVTLEEAYSGTRQAELY